MYGKDIYYEINEYGEEEEVPKPTHVSYTRTIYPNDKMTAKGTKSSVKKEHLLHYQYLDCLKTLASYDVQQNLIRSKNHSITSVSVKKIALSAFDNKRWIRDDGVQTFAHGHWRTNEL